MFEVVVHQHQAVGRKRIGQLEFGCLHIGQSLERLQMLRPHGGDDSIVRMHDTANLVDVADVLGTHFHDKHLMIWAQLLADGAHHTQRRVEAARSHQRGIFLTEHGMEVVLGGGFAIAACYSHYTQSGHALENGASLGCIFRIDMAFQGLQKPCGHNHKYMA